MGEVMDTGQALELLHEYTGVDIDIAAIKKDPLFTVVFQVGAIAILVLGSLTLMLGIKFALRHFGKNYQRFIKLRKMREGIFYNSLLRVYLQMYAKLSFMQWAVLILTTASAKPTTYVLVCVTAVTPFFSYLLMKKLEEKAYLPSTIAAYGTLY